MQPAFHIREATEADIPAIRTLVELSVRGLQKNDYTRAQIEGALGNALGVDTQLIADRTYFVATPVSQADLIVGGGGWSYRKTLFGADHARQRDAALLDPTTDAAKIRAIFVHPDWARRRLGSFILQHCEAAAQQAGFRRFEMGSTLTGVPLYSQRGYVEQGRIEVPLPNGESLTVVRMTKSV